MKLSKEQLRRAAVHAGRACLLAGIEILEVYKTEFTSAQKSDKSPVTEADLRANKVIVDTLSTCEIQGESVPVLAEESKQVPYEERKDWRLFWLVDPLDGTKEFIKKNGEFTVNIGLVSGDKPIVGALYVPVTQQLYFGIPGDGAYVFDAASGKELGLDVFTLENQLKGPDREALTTGEKIRIIGSRSHGTPEVEAFIAEKQRQFQEVEIVAKGSALKFAVLAEGQADTYPRFGPTMEWDTAAGHALVAAVGMRVTVKDSDEDLTYNKQSLLNPAFLVS